jgi:hypothetical protein
MQVFEVNQVLPRFVTFAHLDESIEGLKPLESFVEFNLHPRYRPEQLQSWLAENFIFMDTTRLFEQQSEGESQDQLFKIRFLCLRNSLPLQLEVKPSGEAKVYHEDVQNCVDFVQ